jgi:hypothetical protein
MDVRACAGAARPTAHAQHASQHERLVVPISGVVSYARFSTNPHFDHLERNHMATRKKKESGEGAASRTTKALTRAELKQKIAN